MIVEGTHTTICKPINPNCALVRSLDLLIPKFLNIHSDILIQSSDLKDFVLFEGYRAECKPFYIHRADDDIVNNALEEMNVWMTGPPGCGKTVLGQYSILANDAMMFYVDMSPCCLKDSAYGYLKSLFDSIKAQSEQAGFTIPTLQPSNEAEDQMIRKISDTLASFPTNKPIRLFVDEVPRNTGTPPQLISNLLLALASYHSNRMQSGPSVRFLVATTDEPQVLFDGSSKSKFASMFKPHRLLYWSDCDINRLLLLIFKSLEVRATTGEITGIVAGSNGSPRRLKALARKFILGKSQGDKAVTKLVSEINMEDVK